MIDGCSDFRSGFFRRFWYLSHKHKSFLYMAIPPYQGPAFGLSLHLYPYFFVREQREHIYAGLCEHSILADAISAKIACASVLFWQMLINIVYLTSNTFVSVYICGLEFRIAMGIT